MSVYRPFSLALISLSLLSGGCVTWTARTGVPPVPCTYRFKLLTRPEDQARVEAAIRSVATGPISKSGTASYPEYKFHVRRMADLDRLHPQLLFDTPNNLLPHNRKQVLNIRSGGGAMNFDSTDVSASLAVTVTFAVKPGSRLYFKHPGGHETDITAKVGKTGKVTLPITIREGQKYVLARAVKGSVTRYIRVNIFSNEVRDIPRGAY